MRCIPTTLWRRPPLNFQRAAVLLEVVLALALFVASAAVIGTGLSRATDEVQRLRASAHALDLAVTALSELQMGLRPLKSSEPEPCSPPFEDFTTQIETEPVENDSGETSEIPLVRAKITVRCEDPFTVQRLEQTIPLVENTGAESASPTEPAAPATAPGQP